MTDMVNHPPHYQTADGLEAIDVIKAYFRENYNLGQVFKYIARCGKKNDAIEDLKKARWYLDMEIEWREEEEIPVKDTGVSVPVFAEYNPYYSIYHTGAEDDLSPLERRMFGTPRPGRFF